MADILYDPGSTELSDILDRLPSGFFPDLILLTNLDYVTFLWGLHEVEIPVAATITDSNLCFDAFRNAFPFIHLFVCNEERQSERLRAMGAETAYLPWFGVDPQVFRPRASAPSWDVVFAGNLNPAIHRRRGKLLERLLSVPERFETRVFTGLPRERYAEVLSGARIVFNHSVRSEVNRRVYETLGVGRLLLVEDSNEEVLRYFEDRRHVASYTETSLLDTVEYYLRRSEEREAIAREGHREVLARHTGHHKAQALLEILDDLLRNPKRVARSSTAETLHRSAARVFLHHGRISQALKHSEAALSLEGRLENRVQRARVLGTVAYFEHRRDQRHIDDFQHATQSVLELEPHAAWTRWNHLELGHFLGKLSPEPVREFVGDLREAGLKLEPQGGPLPIAYDPFRVGFETTLSAEFEDDESRTEAQRVLLLARAYEVLGDEERRRGRAHSAMEAYRESLACRSDGYVEQKLGSVSADLGLLDLSREAMKRAVSMEAFLFGAKRDLAALELNVGARAEARATAKAALLAITRPFESFERTFIEVLDHTSAPDGPLPYELGMPIFWEGVFFNTSGYAREASLLIDELLRRGLPISLRSGDLAGQPTAMDAQMRLRFLEASRDVPGKPFVQVVHFFPDSFAKHPEAAASVCRTTYEMDRLPRPWRDALSAFDRVWVTSEFTRQMFLREGIPPERLLTVPNPLGEFPLVQPEPLELFGKRRFNFLSVFEWNPRKGWDVLLRAFLTEFSRSDDVALILRVYSIESRPQIDIRDEMRRFIRKDLGIDPDRVPDILFIDETLSHGEMRSLYAAAQAFVLPSRGEGFGRPYLEALIAGLPVIATRWGGHLDFLTDEGGYLIDIEGLEEVPDDVPQYRGCRWARPSVDHLRVLLRRVYEDPEEGRRKARRAIPEVLSRYNVRRVADTVVRELNSLT
jgi:glycosyltransferase involved in cell wall biosynthesis